MYSFSLMQEISNVQSQKYSHSSKVAQTHFPSRNLHQPLSNMVQATESPSSSTDETIQILDNLNGRQIRELFVNDGLKDALLGLRN